jgi:hypothetical protein
VTIVSGLPEYNSASWSIITHFWYMFCIQYMKIYITLENNNE